MSVSVEQRARRILGKMELFRWAEQVTSEIPNSIANKGRVIGVYNLNDEDPKRAIWISDSGIWILDDLWRLIRFDEIAEVKLPTSKTDVGDSLTLLFLDGTYEAVPVMGRHGRFRDVFEFGSFVIRIIGDLSRISRKVGGGDSRPPRPGS